MDELLIALWRHHISFAYQNHHLYIGHSTCTDIYGETPTEVTQDGVFWKITHALHGYPTISKFEDIESLIAWLVRRYN